jgi:hypothetical protein
MALSLATQRALLDLDAMTGHRRSLAQASDRRKALGLFMVLLDRGERLSAIDVERWLIEQGWGPKWATIAAAMPDDIAAIRTPSPTWYPEQIARWFGEE